MKGLELSRRYYETYGLPMLEKQFPEILDKIAIGLTGSGSECYGFDDEISQDHDFEPGFCIFLPEEEVVDRKKEFELTRAYNKLPAEFEGYKKSMLSPVGGNRHGVFRCREYYEERVGTPDGLLTLEQWLTLPDYVLSEAVNGEIFRDDSGLVTAVRNNLSNVPEDVLKKRIAGNVLLMGQSGQYNYERCLKRNDTGAAQLAINEFVLSTIKTCFLLNGKFAPYYKWSFRAISELDRLSEVGEFLNYLLNNGNDPEQARIKKDMINTVSELLNDVLLEKGYVKEANSDLEKQAYTINNCIVDAEIRNLNILISV